MLRARSVSPKRLEANQRNVQSSHFSGWLVILVLTALLVSITVYIEPPPREREIEGTRDTISKRKKTPNNPHLKVKVKVSHNLIAVWAVGLESWAQQKKGGAHPAPFAALVSPIRKSYPFTAGLTEKVFR